jgi:hypothetical protein
MGRMTARPSAEVGGCGMGTGRTGRHREVPTLGLGPRSVGSGNFPTKSGGTRPRPRRYVPNGSVSGSPSGLPTPMSQAGTRLLNEWTFKGSARSTVGDVDVARNREEESRAANLLAREDENVSVKTLDRYAVKAFTATGDLTVNEADAATYSEMRPSGRTPKVNRSQCLPATSRPLRAARSACPRLAGWP